TPASVSPADAAASETAEFPDIAFDSQGNAIAVWTRTTGSGASLRSALYTPDTGWGDTVSAGNTADVLSGLVAVAPDGTGVAAFEQLDGPAGATGLWVNRFE